LLDNKISDKKIPLIIDSSKKKIGLLHIRLGALVQAKTLKLKHELKLNNPGQIE